MVSQINILETGQSRAWTSGESNSIQFIELMALQYKMDDGAVANRLCDILLNSIPNEKDETMKFLPLLALAPIFVNALPRGFSDISSSSLRSRASDAQTIVTFDEYSLKINGERIMIFSGEVHPWRNPVQSLHLDVLQKIKAMGFSAVSIYMHWGLVEYKKGTWNWDGIFDLQPFFNAAKEAGLYIIARPGPYINAETTAGGFPGWGTQVEGRWRNSNPNYTAAWQPYIAEVGAIIAKNQITNGGPIILVQVENEYSGFPSGQSQDTTYENQLLAAFSDAGIVVPTTTNDAYPGGHFTSVDIYGYDNYPQGFDCSHPQTWSESNPPSWLLAAHESINPNVLNALFEFQGGAFDGWGGSGYSTCAELTGPEFERVFYKNQFAQATTILNLYMTYGGTNWGGLAHPGVYTSYSYGAAINEDRTLLEKYYELKLQANFIKVSPAYLTMKPQNFNQGSQGAYTVGNNQALVVTYLEDSASTTKFFVVRQSDMSKLTATYYQMYLPTSLGTLTVPQLGGSLALTGRDSKIHITNYVAGEATLVYSTAEIMTWKEIDGKTVIVLYGNAGEFHETSFEWNTAAGAPTVTVHSGSSANMKWKVVQSGAFTIQYETTGQIVVSIGSNVLLYISDRVNAYEFWAPDAIISGGQTQSSVIVKGGYLVRTAALSETVLNLTGDLNVTTAFEVYAPSGINTVVWNSHTLITKRSSYGSLIATSYNPYFPAATIPNLENLAWKYGDSLPEISSTYDDSKWTLADKTDTPNAVKPETPVVLYASDYGYHTGTIIWRGHFTAAGGETGFKLLIQGGLAFGYSIWDGNYYLGSWEGDAVTSIHNGEFNFGSTWVKGSYHTLTIVQDHQGLEENWSSDTEAFKTYRGIYSYSFNGSTGTKLDEWRVTGNLGGESYYDWARGPLNEGGLYAERQGWHLPGFDDSKWSTGNPVIGIKSPGIGFFRATFHLNVASTVDYPMSIFLSNSTGEYYRTHIYVNGYQMGKYVNSVGPQTQFPIPHGILNYNGVNTLAVSLWAQKANGANLNEIFLGITAQIDGGVTVTNSPMPTWTARSAAY